MKYFCIAICITILSCAQPEPAYQKEIPADLPPKPQIIEYEPGCMDSEGFPIDCALQKKLQKKAKKRKHK